MIKTISKKRFKESDLYNYNAFNKKLDTDTRYRYELGARINLYKYVVDGIKKRSDSQIALCKETEEVWSAVGLKLKRKNPKCHCYL